MHLAKCLLLLLVGLLALSHDGQGHTHNYSQEAPGPGEGSPSLKIAPSNTAFAFNLYHLMASEAPESNIFFSPLSISAAYAMLSLGARSHTWTQILAGLGFNLTKMSGSEIHQGFQHLLHTLNLPDDKLETRVGSALFLSQDLPLLPRFLNDTMVFYGSRLFRTDFLDSKGTAQLINDHVKEETRGKIENLVDGLSTDTMMVLVNYIYFKAPWEKPFISSRSSPRDFYVDENTKVKVPMMFQDKYHHWYLHDRKLELHFPKFSISGSYDLDQMLPKLGIRDLFSQQANLSGITTQQNLLVSRSFHKAILDVDEAGTEAAAATSVSVTFLSASHNHRVLRFNRPFLVVIFSTKTQSILFLGKVVNPTKP
ncbi:Kallistatin [Pteropus alecto]|uniref:Kallistatin n=1 Tax=Pteropus alecto TaxID=9402 RepID=L5JSI9_PTEAL|nr:Kallistatin [Pteropus alecto]